MSSHSLYERLHQGTEALSLSLTHQQLEQLTQYLTLLAQWNRVYNLTAVRDPAAMVSRHILDSLSIAPYLAGDNILDVGSGPGLPGIPLAIAHPEKRFITVDSNSKKVRFMIHARLTLPLTNLHIEHARVESCNITPRFTTITARAFCSLHALVNTSQHLLGDTGIYLAMKGLYPEQELNELQAHAPTALVKSVPLQVPDSTGARHLIIIRP